jgi:ABC-2 type transport system permease protein
MSSLSSNLEPGHSLVKTFQKYWYIFTIQFLNSLAYPGELLGRSLLIIPYMWIFNQLWRITFASSNSSVINGLTLADTLWYLMMAETLELSRPRLGNMIADSVKDGSIAYVLNKPYDFLVYQFSTAMGETVLRAIMNAVLGSAAVWLMMGPPVAPIGFLIVLPAVIGAWILNFFLAVLIGLTAFVTEDISAYQWIVQKFAFILGGLLIPLDFYPGWLQSIARALPFSAMVYGPSRLFVSPTAETFFNTLSMQLIWIAILGLATILVYRRGVARLTLNGG